MEFLAHEAEPEIINDYVHLLKVSDAGLRASSKLSLAIEPLQLRRFKATQVKSRHGEAWTATT